MGRPQFAFMLPRGEANGECDIGCRCEKGGSIEGYQLFCSLSLWLDEVRQAKQGRAARTHEIWAADTWWSCSAAITS